MNASVPRRVLLDCALDEAQFAGKNPGTKLSLVEPMPRDIACCHAAALRVAVQLRERGERSSLRAFAAAFEYCAVCDSLRAQEPQLSGTLVWRYAVRAETVATMNLARSERTDGQESQWLHACLWRVLQTARPAINNNGGIESRSFSLRFEGTRGATFSE